jgi:hypothetical protein
MATLIVPSESATAPGPMPSGDEERATAERLLKFPVS